MRSKDYGLKMEKMFLGKLKSLLFPMACHMRETEMDRLLSFGKWRLRDDNCMESVIREGLIVPFNRQFKYSHIS